MADVPIRLRPGHPTGTYRRGGYAFSNDTVVMLPEDAVTDEIRNDEWLIVGDDATRHPEPAEYPVDRSQAEQMQQAAQTKASDADVSVRQAPATETRASGAKRLEVKESQQQ